MDRLCSKDGQIKKKGDQGGQLPKHGTSAEVILKPKMLLRYSGTEGITQGYCSLILHIAAKSVFLGRC